MTEAHIKELISNSYVIGIAARAGITVTKPTLDYGIDGTFKDVEHDKIHKRYRETGFSIDFQLKATTNTKPQNGIIKYKLEVKNYNDLIEINVGTPRILIVYDMPKNSNDWIIVEGNKTIFKKCAWWCSLKGLPNVSNKESIVIEIPQNNQLTPEALITLMQKVKNGEDL